MKKNKKSIISLVAAVSVTLMLRDSLPVSAATKEDVVAAARSAGFSEVYIQQGINYLDANPGYTSDDYDMMISSLYSYAASVDQSIDKYFQNNPPADAPEVTEPPVQQTQPSQSGEQTEPAEQTQPEVPKKEYSSMTPEEREEYVAGLTNAQKNEIIKNLDKEQQLEIINGLIDAGAALGMNVTVDELTGDKITYSVRNDDGKIIDNASMGIIIDDTGISYTPLILGSSALILLSAAGITLLSLRQKDKKNNQI